MSGSSLSCGTLVRRPRIDELLDVATARRICLVTGVAGWGKTAAVRSWAQGRNVAWLQPGDTTDARRLAERLAAALPGEPEPSVWPASDGPQTAAAGELICRRLATVLREPLVVAVDDMSRLGVDSAAASLIEAMCWHAPDLLRLVLIARGELPFPLAPLRRQDWVGELDAPQLAFTAPEVAALLTGMAAADATAAAERLVERTAGWPGVVRCAADRLLTVAPGERVASLPGLLDDLTSPGERLHNYLVDEVIGTEPDPVLALLRRLSVFDELPAAAVAPDEPDPARLLADLTRRGLVRRNADAGSRWTLVPPLARCFEHEAVLPDHEREQLHRLAAEHLLADGEQESALRHLLEAGAHSAVADLLLTHGPALVSAGAADAVAEALPAEHRTDPRLQWLLGHAAIVLGRWDEATEYLRRAETGAGQERLEPAIAWGLSLIAFGQGEFPRILDLYARTRFGEEDTASESRLLALVAYAHRIVGDLDSARQLLPRAMTAADRCGHAQASSEVHLVWAMVAAADNERRLAERHYDSALRHAQTGGAVLEVVQAQVSRAYHLLDLGAPRQALHKSEAALRHSRGRTAPLLVAHAHTAHAKASLRLGDLDAALAGFTAAITELQRLGSRFLSWPLSGLGDVYRLKGQLTRARAAYEEALALSEPCQDSYGMCWALTGLARARAGDDLDVARALADRAVTLGERQYEAQAYLARGWIALLAGDQEAAAEDARLAGGCARRRRDDGGSAEAIALAVLASRNPQPDRLAEVIEIWRDTGCRLDEAAARMVAAGIGTSLPAGTVALARQILQARGVEIVRPRAAGPLAVLAHRLPSLEIRALGTFQVLRDGVAVQRTEWQSKKARDLLKILVALRRPVPREELMELLWPGVDPVRSANRLSVLLSMVRDVLHPAQTTEVALASDGSVVWLDRSLVSVDVEDFLAKAAEALDSHRRGSPDSTALLEAAVSAHTGDFLVADPYADWAEPLAEEVRATHIAVLRALSSRHHLAGEVDRAVQTTLRLLGKDPYDEPAHLDLVTVLMGAGRLGEAHRHYRNYVRRMNEIEVAPQSMPRRQVHRTAGATTPTSPGAPDSGPRRHGDGVARNGAI